jgi:hypothetical protein
MRLGVRPGITITTERTITKEGVPLPLILAQNIGLLTNDQVIIITHCTSTQHNTTPILL